MWIGALVPAHAWMDEEISTPQSAHVFIRFI